MEVSKIILPAVLTFCEGVLLFCFTTLANKLFIDPVVALRKTLGDISFTLQYHAWKIYSGNSDILIPDEGKAIFEQLRTLTTRMRADANAIVGYRCAVQFGLIPPHQDIIEGASRLIRISNTLECKELDLKYEDHEAVAKLLRIDVGGAKYKKEL